MQHLHIHGLNVKNGDGPTRILVESGYFHRVYEPQVFLINDVVVDLTTNGLSGLDQGKITPNSLVYLFLLINKESTQLYT